MKKIVSIFAGLLLATNLSAQTWNIGTPIATSVVATLKNDTLVISGTGAMYNYKFTMPTAPWSSDWYRNDVVTVQIHEGVTTVGDYAFAELPNMTSVSIPSSIKSIGERAFSGSSGLAEIYSFATTPPTLGEYAFFFINTASCLLFAGKTAAYQAAEQWGEFENILPCNLSELLPMVVALKADTTAKGTTIANLQVQNSTLSQSNTALQSQNGTLTQSNTVLQGEVSKLKADTLAKRTTIANLQTQNSTLSQSNAALQAQNSELSGSITVLEAEISELRALLANCNGGGVTSAITNSTQSAVKLYPNPATNGQLIVDNEKWNAGEMVEVYSLGGVLMLTQQTAGAVTSVNVSALPSGTYLLKVGRYAAKFVKQ